MSNRFSKIALSAVAALALSPAFAAAPANAQRFRAPAYAAPTAPVEGYGPSSYQGNSGEYGGPLGYDQHTPGAGCCRAPGGDSGYGYGHSYLENMGGNG